MSAPGVITVPTVDDKGYTPDRAAFDPVVALEEAVQYALCLELDCVDCCNLTAAWTRVIALQGMV